jgi:hypothetical protein
MRIFHDPNSFPFSEALACPRGFEVIGTCKFRLAQFVILRQKFDKIFETFYGKVKILQIGNNTL